MIFLQIKDMLFYENFLIFLSLLFGMLLTLHLREGE